MKLEGHVAVDEGVVHRLFALGQILIAAAGIEGVGDPVTRYYEERTFRPSDGDSFPWLRTLKGHPELTKMIQKHDEEILKFLGKLRTFTYATPDGISIMIQFEFSKENPYFKNGVLTKTYLIKYMDEHDDKIVYQSKATPIEWVDGHDIVKENKESFFRFFSPPNYEVSTGNKVMKVVETGDAPSESIDEVSSMQAYIEADYMLWHCVKHRGTATPVNVSNSIIAKKQEERNAANPVANP